MLCLFNFQAAGLKFVLALEPGVLKQEGPSVGIRLSSYVLGALTKPYQKVPMTVIWGQIRKIQNNAEVWPAGARALV